MKAQDVDGVKNRIKELGLETSNMKSLSAMGISDMYCIINHSWTFLFYDYGKEKKQLDEMMPYLVPFMDSATKTKKFNYEIYELENENNYVLYVRVENTLMNVVGPKEQKEKLRSFMRDMGYYP